MTHEHAERTRGEHRHLPRVEHVEQRSDGIRGKEEAAPEIDEGQPRQPQAQYERRRQRPELNGSALPAGWVMDLCRYCFCDGLVTVNSLTTWLSTEYSVNGWYISSQLCSDQNTSRFGDGFQRFFGELS